MPSLVTILPSGRRTPELLAEEVDRPRKQGNR